MLLRRIIDRLLWRQVTYLKALDDDRFIVLVPIRVLLRFDVDDSEWRAFAPSLLEHGWGDSADAALLQLKRRIASGWIAQHRGSRADSTAAEELRRSLARHIGFVDQCRPDV